MEVYPRVKVRQEEPDDPFVEEQETSPSFPLHAFQALSVQEHRLPTVSSPINSGKEDLNNSPPSIANISKSHVPNFATPKISVFEGPEKNITDSDKDGRNIRANPVLRPRAVLSSPDNDGMIGNINQTSKKRPSAIKKNELGQQVPPQGKIKPRSVKVVTPTNSTKGSKESNLKEKQGLGSTVTRQKQYLRKAKPIGG